MSVRTNCYRTTECDIVMTGWLTQYPVCRTCKLEVNDRMYQEFLQRQKDKEKKKDEEEIYDL